MPLRQCLLATALLAALSGLSACGGGGSSEPTSNAVARVFMDGPLTQDNPYHIQGVGDGYVVGVTLELWQDGEYVRDVVTDQDGEVLIGGLKPGSTCALRMYLSDTALQSAAEIWFGIFPWELAQKNAGGDDARDSDAGGVNDGVGAGTYGRIDFTAPSEGEVLNTLAFGLAEGDQS